jgi:hypothetical protein
MGFPITSQKLNSSQIVVNYTDAGDSGKGKSKIGTISGSTITFGSEYIFSSNFIPTHVSSLLEANKFVINYRDQSDSNIGKSVVGIISGSVITFGSASVFNNELIPEEGLSTAYLDTDTFVVLYRNQAHTYGKSKIGTIAGSTITFGSEYIFNEGDVNYLTSVELSTNKFIIGYQRGISPNVTGSIIQGERIGNTLVYSYPNTFYETSSSLTAYLSPTILNNNIVVNYKDLSDAKGKTKIGIESSNISALNLGTGEGQVYKKRDGAALEFRSIKAGNNITVINNANDITINSSSSFPYTPENVTNKSTSTLLGTSNTLYPTQNAVKVYVDTNILASSSVSTGSLTTASNIGTGEGTIFTSVSGSTLQLKTIKAGSNVTITNNANDITINSTASGSTTSNLPILVYRTTNFTFSAANVDITGMSGSVGINKKYFVRVLPMSSSAYGTGGERQIKFSIPSGAFIVLGYVISQADTGAIVISTYSNTTGLGRVADSTLIDVSADIIITTGGTAGNIKLVTVSDGGGSGTIYPLSMTITEYQ